MKILVIGAGMYVTGRNNSGEGTVLASLAQISKTIDIHSVDIIARNFQNKNIVSNAASHINAKINSHLQVNYYATSSVSEYLEANRNYDLAIIVVPDHLHYEITKTTLKNDIHCLVVKPLTPTTAEAKELIRIQRERKLYGAVEFHKRFDESNLLVSRMIRDKTIGDIKYFVIDYSQRISIPLEVFREWSAHSNIFQYLGIHYADLVYFLTGARPLRAMASSTYGLLESLGINTYDSIHALIEWQDQLGSQTTFITAMNISWIDPVCTTALSDQKFRLIGSKGRLDIDQKNRGIELAQNEKGFQHINPYFSDYLPTIDGEMEFQGYGYKSIACFIKDVQMLKNGIQSIGELEKTRPTFKQSLVSTSISEAVTQSLLESSRWIQINYNDIS